MLSIDLLKSAAKRLGAPLNNVVGMAEVESNGESFWTIDGERLPAVREEAHHFSARTGHKFDTTAPDISAREWNPALAARTQAGAWAQVRKAEQLDHKAAWESTSWGPFQVMGFNSHALHYDSIDDFVASMNTEAGQVEAFVRYIEADPILKRALQVGNWTEVENRYNGGGYHGAYALKLRSAVDRLNGLDVGSAIPRAARLGDRGADVRAIQAALRLQPVDGIFGPATDAAVKAFQKANGLVVDGIVGRMTKAELGIVK